jgi:hypothetical protein
LLAPRPTPKLEDHPLSFVRGCLFNIFAANFQLEAVPTIRNPRTRHVQIKLQPDIYIYLSKKKDLIDLWFI